MKRTALVVNLCCVILASNSAAQSAAPVSADRWFKAGTWMLSVEIGGAAFSDFERSEARPADGTTATDFRRRVSARTSVSGGAWASYWISNSWGVRTGLSYVPSSFTVWNEDAAARALESPAEQGFEEASYASLDIWLANATFVFRFPHSFGRVAPYGMAGVGVVKYHARSDADLPPEAQAHFADGDRQNIAGVFGVGATIPLQRRNLLMSFELTNHLSKTPLEGQTNAQAFDLGGLPMELTRAGEDEGEVGFTSHVRLAVGLTLPLR